MDELRHELWPIWNKTNKANEKVKHKGSSEKCHLKIPHSVKWGCAAHNLFYAM